MRLNTPKKNHVSWLSYWWRMRVQGEAAEAVKYTFPVRWGWCCYNYTLISISAPETDLCSRRTYHSHCWPRFVMGTARCLVFFLATAAWIVRSAEATRPYYKYLQEYPPVNETDDRIPLHFAMVLSFGGEYLSIGALPGIQIALDYINREPSILPGYSLHYSLAYSEVQLLVCSYLFCVLLSVTHWHSLS